MWICKNCTSENEDNFDSCWNCLYNKYGSDRIEEPNEDDLETVTPPITFKEDDQWIIVTLALILIAAFFMPWIKMYVGITAWDLIFGQAGNAIDSPGRILGVIIPVSGVLIVRGAAFNNGNYLFSRGLLFSLPFLTLITIAIMIDSKSSSSGIFNMNFFDVFGIGFWLTLISSIILLFLALTTSPIILSTIPESIISEDTKNLTTLVPNSEIQESNNQSIAIDQLEKIQKMKIDGLINEAEYQNLKDKIITSNK